MANVGWEASVQKYRDRTQLSYVLDNADLLNLTGYKVLQNMERNGFVRANRAVYNGKTKLVYDIAPYQPLLSLMPALTPEAFAGVACSLIDIYVQVRENGFLHSDNVSLDPMEIFVDININRAYVIYTPFKVLSTPDSFGAFENTVRGTLMQLISQFPNVADRNTSLFLEQLRSGAPMEDAGKELRNSSMRLSAAGHSGGLVRLGDFGGNQPAPPQQPKQPPQQAQPLPVRPMAQQPAPRVQPVYPIPQAQVQAPPAAQPPTEYLTPPPSGDLSVQPFYPAASQPQQDSQPFQEASQETQSLLQLERELYQQEPEQQRHQQDLFADTEPEEVYREEYDYEPEEPAPKKRWSLFGRNKKREQELEPEMQGDLFANAEEYVPEEEDAEATTLLHENMLTQPKGILIEGVNTAQPVRIIVDRSEFVLGKNPNTADGPLTFNPAISRQHCRIICKDGQFYVMDMGSLNGTWVNDIRVTPQAQYPLRVGDRLKLADSEFVVRLR